MNQMPIRNILLISLSNLGDVILTTPVMTALKEHFPNARLSVLAGPKATELLTGSRTVDELLIYDKKRLSGLQKLNFVLDLRKKHFDLVVDLRNTLIPFLIGARLKNWPSLTRGPVSMRERHLSRLHFLKIPPPQSSFDFFGESDLVSARQKLSFSGIPFDDGFVVLAPGAGSYLKRWGAHRFREVAHYLVAQRMPVVLMGSAEEREIAEEVGKHVSKPIVNACGLLALREVAALLSIARLVICNDSAIMHLANEENIPVVSVFGPTDERKYAQFRSAERVIRRRMACAPCERAHCLFTRQACLDDIVSEEVIAASEGLLHANGH